MKKNYLLKPLSALILLTFLVVTGCKKTSDVSPATPTVPGTTVVQANDAEQVTASVAIIITDENNVPLENAFVSAGNRSGFTSATGVFYFKNISISKNNGSVTVLKPGYFKGVRSFRATAGKDHKVKIQMMAKSLSGTVSGIAGGNISITGGAGISFSANSFVTTSGAAYTGTVNIYGRWINPLANNMRFIIPGDLRGIGSNGAESVLQSYGMVGAMLEDQNGNELKIASGKKATVTFPVPAALAATSGATMPLWHFDEPSARWRQEGTATKSGNSYTAAVDKFSFWNVDLPADFVDIDFTLINVSNGLPVAGALTQIKAGTAMYGYGTSNGEGFLSGAVPKNVPLTLEVLSWCYTVIYSQTIGPLTSNTSLGNINLAIPANNQISFSGNLKNCAGAAVSNGYISVTMQSGADAVVPVSTSGAFAFSILNCGSLPQTYSYRAADLTTLLQTGFISGTATTPNINLGNIAVCAGATAPGVYYVGSEAPSSNTSFAKMWTDVSTTTMTNGYSASDIFIAGDDVYISGYSYAGTGSVSIAKYWKNGVPVILGDGVHSSSLIGISVSGSDVYTAGFESTGVGIGWNLKVWKNGVATTWASGINNNTLINKLFVSGSDVYLCGQQWNGVRYTAKTWKNGVGTTLTSGTTESNATSIFVNGTDAYVAGNEYNAAGDSHYVIWKNSLPYYTGTAAGGGASSIFVSGNDIYFAGSEYDGAGYSIAKVWKNGLVVSTLNTPGQYVDVRSIFVLNSDIYLSGRERFGAIWTAKGWKNGVGVNLTDGINNANAVSLFVKP